MTDATECRWCGASIEQRQEKALSGEFAIVWSDPSGEWVCAANDGDEHEPGKPLRPVKVIVKHGGRETMMRLTYAEYGNFVVRPIDEALDDGEAAWDLGDRNPERRARLAFWAKHLYDVTGQ